MNTECLECGRGIVSDGGRGPTKRLCSARCRKRASRRKTSQKGLPASMASRATWVRARGKRPLHVGGSYASSTAPSTWSTFNQVQLSQVGDGFGIMLGDGLGCYDIDHCFEGGKVKEWVRDYIQAIPEEIVYMEVSKSGEGLHLFFNSSDQARGSNRGGVEKYTRDRFIRTTLNTFSL